MKTILANNIYIHFRKLECIAAQTTHHFTAYALYFEINFPKSNIAPIDMLPTVFTL
jgi:hypothetical protein